ncbi:hypothetical protein ABT297_25770 [Dactylosporangium sp. NPDC000555]|uniref:hypothetical protein n=1 Tax=Dactylosporangium sp. NPDC000555 TaxID=3154260 RepID=UPI00332A50A0
MVARLVQQLVGGGAIAIGYMPGRYTFIGNRVNHNGRCRFSDNSLDGIMIGSAVTEARWPGTDC